MMDVEFGWFLDRAPWTFRGSRLNAVRVGRQGLTQLLQTRLGITRPDVPHIYRVNQYAARLRATDRPDAWFHRSFALDPWSTAQELLYARDELVANGWAGQLPEGGSSALLSALAELEAVRLPLSAALADDIAALPAALATPLPVDISTVRLQHTRNQFPAIWQEILSALEARGTDVVEPGPETGTAPGITVLGAETEREAAEHAARWLAAGPAEGSTAVVTSSPTAILDQHLDRHGLPALGVSEKSAWRAQDQIIPLFFEVVWGPANVQLLGEFLSLPGTPVPRQAARALLRALRREPGTGGPAWQDALSEIASEPKLGPDPAAQLDALFSRNLLPEQGTVSGAEVAAKASWLSARLARLAAVREELKPTLAQLQDLQALLAGMPQVSRQDLRRMAASIIPPTSDPLALAHASPWLHLRHLNELTDHVDSVIWWGFQSATVRSARRWDSEDIAALERAGVHLPAAEQLAALEVAQTVAASRRCRRLVIVQTAQQRGEQSEGNPLLEALVAAQPDERDGQGAMPSTADRVAARTVSARKTVNDGVWSLAGRAAPLVPVSRAETQVPPSSFAVPASPHFLPDSLSFTQLGNLIGCTLAWVLQKKAGLKPSDAQNVPTGNAMIGTLTHKVVEDLHRELAARHEAVPSREHIGATFDRLVPLLASELLLPGRASELGHLRSVVKSSVLKFFSTLSKAGVVIQAMEESFTRELPLSVDGEERVVQVEGSADVVGIDSEGRRVVIDLKWNNWDKYKRAEVREGKALQLALYQWALAEDGGLDAPTAFYMIKQATFASTDPAFGNPIESLQSPAVLWKKAVRAAEFSISEVVNGRLTAGPLADAERARAGEPYGEELAEMEERLHGNPPCRFCHFARLCGLKGDFS
jgi:ATP-dependent helicase/nuclease subunit B